MKPIKLLAAAAAALGLVTAANAQTTVYIAGAPALRTELTTAIENLLLGQGSVDRTFNGSAIITANVVRWRNATIGGQNNVTIHLVYNGSAGGWKTNSASQNVRYIPDSATAGSGATDILSIDSSAPALDVARRNGDVNGLDIGELMEADAFTALRGLRDRARQYDLIALDPPKLANNERQLEKASRAYKDLNLLAIKLLAPGGTLLTWSCSGAMNADLFQKVVAGAALDAGRTVRIVDRLSQPSDHPVPLAFPEAEYLKGLVLEAE
jgi:hypothetical protein